MSWELFPEGGCLSRELPSRWQVSFGSCRIPVATLPWEGRSSAPGRGYSSLMSFVDSAFYLPSPHVPRDPPGGAVSELGVISGRRVTESESGVTSVGSD